MTQPRVRTVNVTSIFERNTITDQGLRRHAPIEFKAFVARLHSLLKKGLDSSNPSRRQWG
jgi:hypothetical protein